MNTIGTLFRLTTFGESHGPGVGGVIDGFPAGIEIDMDFIQHELDRRKPGQSALTTPRKESDKVEILSGVYEGFSTGCPIGFLVRNENQHSADYDNLRDLFRPSHADFTYYSKYGIRDHRGGGQGGASGRSAGGLYGASGYRAAYKIIYYGRLGFAFIHCADACGHTCGYCCYKRRGECSAAGNTDFGAQGQRA